MAGSRPYYYQVLVYIAYGFYIALGLAWVGAGLLGVPSHLNPIALLIVMAFALQAYYRHLLTNLIFGIITLFFSIFMMLLPSLNMVLQPSPKGRRLMRYLLYSYRLPALSYQAFLFSAI